MQILKFKTDISGQEAIDKVTPLLNQKENISKWDIDPSSDDNILSISGEKIDPQQIENLVQEAGYKAEPLRIVGTSGEGL